MLLAHPDSKRPGAFLPWPALSSLSACNTLRNAATLARALAMERFDIVHSFSRIADLAPIQPLVVSEGQEISARNQPKGGRLRSCAFRQHPEIQGHQPADGRPVELIWRRTLIPNGVPLARYTFQPKAAPQVLSGALSRSKVRYLAIEIARRTGRQMIITGNSPEEKRAWVVARDLCQVDGDSFRYIGPVDDA